MKLKKAVVFLAIPILALAVGVLSWFWLLHSEPGARWVFSRVESTMAGSLGASSVSGDLGSGLNINGLWFDNGNTRGEADRATIAVNINLLPPAVGLKILHVDDVVIRELREPPEESGQQAQVQDILQSLSLPIPVWFKDIRLNGLEYHALAAEQSHTAESIRISGSWHREVKLDQVSVTAVDQNLDLTGELGFSAPYPLDVELQATGDVEIKGTVKGNLESSEVHLSSQKPELQIDGTLEQLLLTPSWNLVITSSGVQWPMDAAVPDVILTGVDARSIGEWPNYNLELTGELELDGLGASRLTLAGEGSTVGFTARELTLTGPELGLRATGRVSLEDELELAVDVVLEYLEPGYWLEEWPRDQPVSGVFAAEWGGDEVMVSTLKLTVAETPMSIEGRGSIDIQEGSVDGELNWNDVTWPPASPDPVIASKKGAFLLSGTTSDWKLDGSLFVKTGEYPEGQLKLGGTGNGESLDITLHEGSVLGGTLAGRVDWNWTDKQPFNAQLSIQQIDTQALNADYPAVLNSRLTASGDLEPFRLQVDFQELSGTFLERPFNGGGGFYIEQGRVFADGLLLKSGESSLALSGSLYDTNGMTFAANINSLADISSDLNGTIAAEGVLSLNPDTPGLSAMISGQQLEIGGIEIGQIETRKPVATGFESGQEFIFTGLVAGDQPIDSVAIRLAGDTPLQKLAVSAIVEGANIDMVLDGSVNDWQNPFTSGWSGKLSELQFGHLPEFQLSLEQPAGLELHPTRFSLEASCLSGTREARLCLESAWEASGNLSLSAELAAIPVALLELFTDTELKFTQILSGAINWSQSVNGDRTGSAQIKMSPGTITGIDDEVPPFNTGPGLFAFDLAGGQLRQGNLDLIFPGLGDVDIDFGIPDIKPGLRSPIRGQARIDLADISSLAVLFPIFDTFEGLLDVDMALSGTLADPAFNGKVAFQNGQVANSGSGFSFSEINITGNVIETDRSELKGSFLAGEGKGEILTTINFADILSPAINLSLKGTSLTLIDVPELNLVADPDIDVSWLDKTLEIKGRLLIPSARLAPSFIPASTVRQSEDLVIVTGELPAPEKGFLEENAVKVRGNLDVELGENILIDLDVAEISATGRTAFKWNDNLIPIATGHFDLSGDIQAYGQFLRITQGRIGYPGTPADNPHLNIRAEREIFGNVQIRRAGLMVAGTLNRMVIEPYTVPMTTRERAQTLLVTGSDFNYEQGVGAVDVGMYVLPRLYVSYGIGVFEDGNVLKLRYDLGRGFGIRATSGQRESGMDISYTIER